MIGLGLIRNSWNPLKIIRHDFLLMCLFPDTPTMQKCLNGHLFDFLEKPKAWCFYTGKFLMTSSQTAVSHVSNLNRYDGSVELLKASPCSPLVDLFPPTH